MKLKRLRNLVWRIRLRGRAMVLLMRNLLSRTPVSGGSGPVVSLTTHGERTSICHITIESIARGSLRPTRLILWLDDASIFEALPAPLRRLKQRGLEIHLVENFGPHTKYFPYVEAEEEFSIPLVTADDDIIYSAKWLEQLTDEWNQTPQYVVAFRARRIALNETGIAPYSQWQFSSSTAPSLLNFATGVGGVIYPPTMLRSLKLRGREFMSTTRAADDVWLHNTALREGIAIRQVTERAQTFPVIERAQVSGLKHSNVAEGRNDEQIMRTYSPDDVALLKAHLNGNTSIVK